VGLPRLLAPAATPLQIDAEFPGGNIVVDFVEGDHVRLHQDLRDTDGDWFYWAFRVRGAAGRTVTFTFTGSNPIGARGPAVSLDAGATWRWLGLEAVDGQSFTLTFPTEPAEARFAMAIPYQEADLRAFVSRHADHPALRMETLCPDRHGRPIELLRLGRSDGGAAWRILLTARQHCCEAMASHSLEGLLEAALGDGELGRWFRAEADLLAVPFMDKDGVEQGDQGKNRRPHDHNRDWDGDSLYPSVRALRKLVPAWSGGKLDVALDLHCPWLRGGRNEAIFLVGSRVPRMAAEQERFSTLLEAACTGPLRHHTADNLPHGREWNTDEHLGGLLTFCRWATAQPGVRLASTIEIPYATVRGVEATPDGARTFGRDLAATLRRYLTISA
jgi:hypothetical protein